MYKPERLSAFCDGVIAIAITLLVLGLEVPSVHAVSEKDLRQYLLDSLHSVFGYVTSFLLIGTYWLQHYVVFHYILRVDRVFVALNGLFLLAVSFVPFPTGLQAGYRHDEMAMVIYAASQAVCGLSLAAIWHYATYQHRLVRPELSPQVVFSVRRRLLCTPAISLAAIAISFVSIEASRFLFLGHPHPAILPSHGRHGSQAGKGCG